MGAERREGGEVTLVLVLDRGKRFVCVWFALAAAAPGAREDETQDFRAQLGLCRLVCVVGLRVGKWV